MRDRDYKTVSGTYGSQYTRCNVFVYKGWYCVEGSKNINRTGEDIEPGVDVELLSDDDCMTASVEIDSIEELIDLIDEQYYGDEEEDDEEEE